jgi:hypothetical protein
VDVVVGARFDGEGDYAPRAATLGDVPAGEGGQPPHRRPPDGRDLGFRVAGPRAVSLFAQRYPADYLGDTVESLLLAHSAGLRLCQQPVRMRSRSGGLPSTPPLRSTLYLLRALLVLVVFLAAGRRSGRSVARS